MKSILICTRIIDFITMLLRKVKSLIGLLKTKYFYPKHIQLHGKIFVSSIPNFVFKENGKLIIGNNVKLNSNKNSYHLIMYSPVKLMVDRKNAVIKIGANSRIHGSCIHAHSSIEIGKNCLIAANCQIFDDSGHDLSMDYPGERIKTKGMAKPIIIEDNVWIGANSIILPGVKIGNGSVIGAGSVVLKDIPSRCLAGGNPAKVIKQY